MGSGCPATVGQSSEPVFPEDPRQGCASPHPPQVLDRGLSEQASPVDRALCSHLSAYPAPLDGRAPSQHVSLRLPWMCRHFEETLSVDKCEGAMTSSRGLRAPSAHCCPCRCVVLRRFSRI